MMNPLAGLGGCLVSETPLIAAGESGHPVAPGLYAALEQDGSDSGDRFMVAHAGPDTTASKRGDDPIVLRFRGVGDGLHAMQAHIEDVCLYGAIRVAGERVEIWLAGGAALTAEDRVRLGISTGDGDCELPNGDALAAAVRIVAASKPADGAFVLER